MKCEPLTPELAEPLADLFRALREAGDEERFHPHPLTGAEAERLSRYEGRDVYRVLTEDGRVVAYGILRGWDAGFEIPALGIAVHPGARRAGLGRLLMEDLHRVARERGAGSVRLTVYATNEAARRLYEGLGYELEERGDDLVGYLAL
jgi:ribosomal protein S18 acetylase RimI-like enzyme